jgi:hypothetical protein
MADERLGIHVGGPVTRQALRLLAEAHAHGDAGSLLVAATVAGAGAKDRDEAAALARAVNHDGLRSGPRLRASQGEVSLGALRVVVSQDEGSWPAVDRVLREDQAEAPEATHASVASRLLELLGRAFGLRWISLELASPDAGPDTASHLLRRHSQLTGKLSSRSRNHAEPIACLRLAAVASGPASLESLLDLIRAAQDEDGHSASLQVVATRPSEGQILGRAQAFVDAESCDAIGPLIRVVLRYDPVAIRARRLLGAGGST